MDDHSSVPTGAWRRSAFFLRLVWPLVRGDRALIGVAALGMVLNALAAAIVFGGASWLLHGPTVRLTLGLAGAALAYPVMAVSTYCNVVLLRIADARLDGRPCTARQGFAEANRRLPAILSWSLLAAGVGALLDKLAQWIPGGAVASWVLGVAWSLATLFALPVLALEDGGPAHAARRSAEIFRARWGDGIAGQISIGGLTLVVTLPAVVALVAGLAMGGATGIVLAAAGGALLIATRTAVGALGQLFALAIYRHQTLGAGAFGLTPEQLALAVHTTPRKGR